MLDIDELLKMTDGERVAYLLKYYAESDNLGDIDSEQELFRRLIDKEFRGVLSRQLHAVRRPILGQREIREDQKSILREIERQLDILGRGYSESLEQFKIQDLMEEITKTFKNQGSK
jgi:hypothetical protein